MRSNLAEVIAFPCARLLRSDAITPPRRRRAASQRIEHLTREQVAEVLALARSVSERDWLLLLITFWHGLRASEAIALTPDHFADGFLTVQRLKGSLRTRQPLATNQNPLLNERAAIESWLERQPVGRGERMFPISRFQFYRRLRFYGSWAGLPRHLCHPHVLKHSIAMQSIRGAGIENVRQHLGHRSLSSTGAYLKVSDEAASVAVIQAVEMPHKTTFCADSVPVPGVAGNNTGRQFTEMLPFES